MRRIRNHKLAAGFVITVLAAVVWATPSVRRGSASKWILKGVEATPLANRTARVLTPGPLGPETTPFNGTYSDAPSPIACGPRHKFTIPAGKTRIIAVATADVPSNDIVLKLYGPSGDQLSSNDTVTSPESATHEAPSGIPAGAYEVEVCPYNNPSVPPTAPYTYRGTFTTDDTAVPVIPNPVSTPTPGPVGTPTPGSPPIPPRYHNYAAGPGLGDSAGEPTVGFNLATKRAMYIAGLQTLQITFPENIAPAGTLPEAGPADWKDVSFVTTRIKSLDPILFTDQGTGRTFVSQLNDVTQVYQATGLGPTLIGLNSLMAYTDDDGATWTPAQINPPDGSYDHQTVGSGPYPAALAALANPLNKGSAVYYCAQVGVTAFCSRSDDGGLNFGRPVPIYQAVSAGPVTGCGGIHGHVKVAPDGTVYIPNYNCGGKQGVVVSTDAGTTWTVRQVTGSTLSAAGILDPSIGISRDPKEPGGTSNTVYFSYVGKIPGGSATDNHVFVTASRDRGLTWSTPINIGTSVGVVNAVFPSVVAGDANRAAVAFLGTTTGGNHEAADFKGTWYGFVAHTYDGGASWTTVNATPKGPVQREACIWNQGGNNPCRNLLDFNDATVDDKGRVLFSFADGCIDGCETGGPNSYSAKASLARQSGGKGLYAQFDTPEPALPKRPYLAGFRDDQASYLNWNAPDNGGSSISGYKIYRRAGSGPETLIGQAAGSASSYNDRNVDALVATYHYRITAINALGESLSSNPLSLIVEPRREASGACHPPGVTAITDPAGDANDTLAQHDITSVSVSEPENLAGKLVFTMKVGNLQSIPPGFRWAVRFGVKKGGAQQSPPTDVTGGVSEDYFVSMVTSDGPTPTFTWGVTSVPQNASRVFTTKGSLDGASNAAANGVITLVIPKSLVNNPAPGDMINNMLASVRATIPSALPGTGGTNETIPDSTGGGLYTLRTATLCLPNTAPIAMITANTARGDVPLTLTFNGNGSRDSDSIDSIASYTFNFGDGSDDVTQSSPIISHTFTQPGEFITRLVVTDSRGKVSSNTAMFKLDVEEPVQCPTNVARFSVGAGASASSTYNAGYAPNSVIDGERKGLNWGNLGGWNDGTRGTYPDWVEVAFNGPQTLTQVRVFTVQNDFLNPVEPDENTLATVYGVQDFEVQYWEGSQWVTVPNGAVTGNDKAMRVFAFPEITTTKIRVFVTNARNNFSRLTEVEAIGCPASP